MASAERPRWKKTPGAVPRGLGRLAAERHGALGEVRRGDLAANEREAFT